jgi:hypothetical protein
VLVRWRLVSFERRVGGNIQWPHVVRGTSEPRALFLADAGTTSRVRGGLPVGAIGCRGGIIAQERLLGNSVDTVRRDFHNSK